MTDSKAGASAAEIAGEILVAYLSRQSVEPEDLPRLVRAVRAALSDDIGPGDRSEAMDVEAGLVLEAARGLPGAVATPAGGSAAGRAPAVPIDQSIGEDYLVCLEDGERFKTLRRHLKAKYGLTAEAYRAKWGLPEDYPMVAPALAQRRSELARELGLGRRGGARKPQPRRA